MRTKHARHWQFVQCSHMGMSPWQMLANPALCKLTCSGLGMPIEQLNLRKTFAGKCYS